MSQQRSSSFYNSQAELCRTVDKTFRGFFLEILDACRNVSEEAQRISYNIQTSKNLIKLLDTGLLVMRDQLSCDAVYGIDTVIDFYAGHLYGSTIDVAHDYSNCREDGGQK